MEELLAYTKSVGDYDFPILSFLFNSIMILIIVLSIVIFIYDRYIQRKDQLLINYPLIGRMRYFFYLIRDPMRQYFGDEKFYESFDKVQWVYNASSKRSVYASFSPSQPQKSARLSIKASNTVLNIDQVQKDFSVTFGNKYTFTSSSIIGRSAMSDGAISPEGTRAFAKGAKLGDFVINTGEGGLTSNFFYTHSYQKDRVKYFDVVEGTFFAKSIYKIVRFFLNRKIAQNVYKHMVLYSQAPDSYLFCPKNLLFYRINWNSKLENFPSKVPNDLPDIVFQMGSGLYGVRDKDGNFDELKYKKL